jgi:signal transduction histidine kinase
MTTPQSARGPNAVRDLVDADRELALLRELIQAASSGPGVEPLAAAAARMITAATGTDVCFVHVLDDSDRSLTLAGATPPFDGQVGKIRLPLGSGISGWVARHREPVVIIHDKEADPRYLPIESLRGRDFTSMVSVPMETDPGGLVGVLNVHTVARREFTDGDVELLRVIGRLIAGAMHQARLHRRLVARERSHELFVEQVIEAQEIERRRLAGDIHDGISQRLITLSYRLDAAARAVSGDPKEASEQLDEARELAGLTLQEARAAISGLRPPVLDDLGLAGGLASLARSIPQLDLELQLSDVRLPNTSSLRCTASPRKACKTSSNMPTHRWRGCASRWKTTMRDSKSSTTGSVSIRSRTRWAATRWAATGCCRWPNAPSWSAGG